MTPETLKPNSSLLCEEYVLVQAWKKASSYIRSHNWYADTLELDSAAVNLPDFIKKLQKKLSPSEPYFNDPLRFVPAPKSQRWHVNPESDRWEPVNRTEATQKIRPLAHVSLEDQVVSTALMLCLADRIETLQNDPRSPTDSPESREKVISYGNRLYCDNQGGQLRHRWGSSKLYRAFSEDYRSFLARPEAVAQKAGSQTIVVTSDLSQFFDRVRPKLLMNKVLALRKPGDDPKFFKLFQSLFNWQWDSKDKVKVAAYAKTSGLHDFTQVALPQGLVASGFFANIILLDFDQALRDELGREFIPGSILLDACRYVDDIRFVLSVDGDADLNKIEDDVFTVLQNLLGQYAKGMIPSRAKTRASFVLGGGRPMVRQSRKMERIQKAISGGFDATGGVEILDAVQGLLRTQARHSENRKGAQCWGLSPVPDVADDTVGRFAAARFRSTFRSLRPLLVDRGDADTTLDANPSDPLFEFMPASRTRSELDEEAQSFALGLIENWVQDPSNVRLLRIGLDIWPAGTLLQEILEIISQYTIQVKGAREFRQVALYCLAEIFRAGATETGFVEDDECLPSAIDIDDYRAVLFKEAQRLIAFESKVLPWYLKQQILLFMTVYNYADSPVASLKNDRETRVYRQFLRFLRGDIGKLRDADFATFAILSRRSYLDAEKTNLLLRSHITSDRATLIARQDPLFGLEIFHNNKEISLSASSEVKRDLCLNSREKRKGWITLAELVKGKPDTLQDELALLRFAYMCLKDWPEVSSDKVITPHDVFIRNPTSARRGSSRMLLSFRPSRLSKKGSLYNPPEWCAPDDNWRFRLGYLLRYILTSRSDFTRNVKPCSWKEGTTIYRTPDHHWYQGHYGHYSGQSAFGNDWLAISDWTEQLLYALLRWPGCSPSDFCEQVDDGIEPTRRLVRKRIRELYSKYGRMSDLLMLPVSSRWPEVPKGDRPLRICVAQTVIPDEKDIVASISDLTLSGTELRRRHRNHLSAMLAAVRKMLDLRETHKGSDGRLDLLILPELSVHPRDVKTHLEPFARQNKTIIVAGLTYEELFQGEPLVNSALWLLPVWSRSRGLEIVRRRQGKQHLAPSEKRMNNPTQKIQGFRPCQWLIGYEWDATASKEPLWLTASVCYDATDIKLAADLRDQSDVFAVTAMNRDVNTFDQMALALQYHMFQMVIVANNGDFGGSNAYAPYRKPYNRQVFHMHGQPQASIAFLEIDDVGDFLKRNKHAQEPPFSSGGISRKDKCWKCPPAGICEGESCPH